MSEDYTYPPTPRMVRAEELDAMRARAEAAEAKLAAVPVDAIRRVWQQEYEDRYEDGRLYDAESQWADDSNVVEEWLKPATSALEARDWQRENDLRKVQS